MFDLAVVHGSFSGLIALSASIALIIGPFSVASELTRLLLGVYCAIDFAAILKWPSLQPGFTRWLTIFLHHASVLYAVFFWKKYPEFVEVLLKTCLIEISNVFLCLHRYMRTSISHALFGISWVLIRLGVLAVTNLHVFSLPIEWRDKLIWFVIPLLSLFWTAEALMLLPPWLCTKWDNEFSILPVTSGLLAIPIVSFPLDRAFYILLACIASCFFHARPTEITRRLDGAAVGACATYHIFKTFGSCSITLSSQLSLAAAILCFKRPDLRTVFFAVAVARGEARAPILVNFISLPIIGFGLYLKRTIVWGSPHKCTVKCFYWHLMHTLLMTLL